MSDYLFDKQGEPDPEIERLETLLAPLAYRPSLLSLPAPAPRSRARRVLIPIALVAAA
ncbi:MAG: hypothetical protein JWM53_4306, partial [bacterium]|nr:hypothetical protein [bacterium]